MLLGNASFGAETSERLVNQALGNRRVASQSMGQSIITRTQGSSVPPQKDTGGDSRFDPASIAKHKQLDKASPPSNLRQGRELRKAEPGHVKLEKGLRRVLSAGRPDISQKLGSTRAPACCRRRLADGFGVNGTDSVVKAVGASLGRGAPNSTRGACAPRTDL